MMETGLRHLKTEDDSRGRVADADCRWEPCGGWEEARLDVLDQRVWARAPRDRDTCMCLTEPGLASRREIDG